MVTKRRKKMEKLNEKPQVVEAVSIEPELSEAAVQQIEQQLADIEEKTMVEESTSAEVEKIAQEATVEAAAEVEATDGATVSTAVETIEEPIVETTTETTENPVEQSTKAEKSNTEPLLSSWTQTFQTANAIQEELENWTLHVLEQQRELSVKALNQSKQQWEQLSRGLSTYIPQAQEFLNAEDFKGQDLWLNTQDQLESITKTLIEQNRQARKDVQSWLETSAAPFEQIGKMFYPFK